MKCPICNSDFIDDLNQISYSITSDLKMINDGVTTSICNNCGNLFNSTGSRNKISNFYQQSYELMPSSFKAETQIYQKNVLSISDWRLLHLQSLNKLAKKGKILDIGCGKGNFLLQFKKFFPYWNLYGIESSKSSFLSAKENLSSDTVLYQGIYKKYIFHEKFDLIVALNVLEHVENPRQFLQDIRDDLTDDGIVCFDVPNFKVNPSDVYVYDHLTHFTVETLKNLLEHTGYQILKLVENINHVPILVICKKVSFTSELKNFSSLTRNLIQDSLNFNNELFNQYSKINTEFTKFGIVGIGIPIWMAIYDKIIDISKISCFFDENSTIIGSKFSDIIVKKLSDLSSYDYLPLLFSVSPCYLEQLNKKIMPYGNKTYFPTSCSYFLKYFN